MKKAYAKGETIKRVAQAASPHLPLVYDGLGGGHNGEYYWYCPRCKQSDWIAHYGDPTGLLDHLPCEEQK